MSGTRHESDTPTVSFGLELSQVSTLNGRRPTGVYHFYWTMGDRLEPKGTMPTSATCRHQG